MSIIVKGFGVNSSVLVKGFGGLISQLVVKVLYSFSKITKLLNLKSKRSD
jgi:hypothetical protein